MSVFYLLKGISEVKQKLFNQICFVYKENNTLIDSFSAAVAGYSKSISMIMPDIEISTIKICETQKISGLENIDGFIES